MGHCHHETVELHLAQRHLICADVCNLWIGDGPADWTSRIIARAKKRFVEAAEAVSGRHSG